MQMKKKLIYFLSLNELKADINLLLLLKIADIFEN